MSNGIGRVWAVNAEGGDEGRPNGVGPVYIENADQLGSKLPEPAAGDAGKVLGVLNSSGDIGWVEDQSGTLTQVQSDWTEDDSSQVSYIQNKPALATVATSGSYNDLSNKPTIPTVSDNVAKLQYGVATYAQVVAAFNAGKSIYLYDGDTDDGAVCSDITFGDDGGEIIFSRHNAYGSAGSRTEYKVTHSNVWSTTTKNVAVPTVDQSYSASSTNAQSGTAVAGALANIKQVPSSTSADEDKVLTVNSSGTPVWATAQSGSSYTFSNPIKETSGTVSLDYDTDTLSASTTSWTQFDRFDSSASGDARFRASQGYMIAEVLNFGGPWSTISLHIPGNTYYSQNYNSYRSYFISLSKDPYLATSADRTITYIGHPLATEEVTLYGDTRTAVAEQDVVINFTDLINTSLWTPKQFDFSDKIYLGIVIADTSTTSPANEPLVSVDDSATVPVKYSSTVAAPLTVKNPLPASTSADEGKVLTVGSSGLEWVNGGGALYIDYGSVSLSTRADALALAEQIQGAIDANKAVVLKYSDTYANTFYLSLTKFNLDPTVGSESGVIQFMCGANVVTEPTGTHLYSYLWNVTITTSGFTDGRMSFFYGDVSAPTPIPT